MYPAEILLFLTQSGHFPVGSIAMQQTDAACAENW